MLSAPETYDLSPEATLGFRSDDAPPEEFDAFWADFREEILSHSPAFVGSIDGPFNRLVVTSLRRVRVVARLALPDAAPKAFVVTTHGYDGVPDGYADEREPLVDRGFAVLRLRVRGYPPSVMDVPDLRGSWILHHVESPHAWILRGAVADVVQAVRGLRWKYGEHVPVALHGESLGGGLATIAAAQLALAGRPVDRIVLGLPSLGAWRWRAGRYSRGLGGQLNVFLDCVRDPTDRARLLDAIRLFDACFHAPAVECPALTKLATADDVVPAPSAAAIFNALGSDAKLRFVTRFGHFDGGIADARRHALFERIVPEFLDPAASHREVAAARRDEWDLP